ncbi:hypothetical protein MVES_003348 [Malassezia vespertilionis]|uniref:MARVEL domain-containing protein n=1 Tax=Malassezia vespertilionis TaxID=2020962 RepID=A0A2N1J7L6_9BASI|nr:hypothetical protein MVES_003348 [Malassezia vespertilionis]
MSFDLSSTVRRGHPIAFGIFALFSLIVAIISSAVVASFNNNGQPSDKVVRDSTRFMIFAGWWSFIFSIVYIVLFLTGIGGFLSSIASHAVFIVLTWIFWLAGSAALSSKVGDVNCSDATKAGAVPYVPSCTAVKTIVAFGWIGWIELTFLLCIIIMLGVKAFTGGRGVSDGFA